MRKHFYKLGFASMALGLAIVGGSTVLALPAQASGHAQATATQQTTTGTSAAATGQANGQANLAAARLKSCQNRETAINNIISRIDTRAQNQITLFGTIATRVENFYTSQGKTVSNYAQLVAAVNSAKTQANADFGTLKTNSTFSCSSSNPKAVVTAFQSYLKTEISDLQNYRTAVKNLIVGVASANGTTVSDTSKSSTTGGQ